MVVVLGVWNGLQWPGVAKLSKAGDGCAMAKTPHTAQKYECNSSNSILIGMAQLNRMNAIKVGKVAAAKARFGAFSRDRLQNAVPQAARQAAKAAE